MRQILVMTKVEIQIWTPQQEPVLIFTRLAKFSLLRHLFPASTPIAMYELEIIICYQEWVEIVKVMEN
jgi:hypothetical protein